VTRLPFVFDCLVRRRRQSPRRLTPRERDLEVTPVTWPANVDHLSAEHASAVYEFPVEDDDWIDIEEAVRVVLDDGESVDPAGRRVAQIALVELAQDGRGPRHHLCFLSSGRILVCHYAVWSGRRGCCSITVRRLAIVGARGYESSVDVAGPSMATTHTFRNSAGRHFRRPVFMQLRRRSQEAFWHRRFLPV
jgi:hypothetical protein